jgi:hypothetical protein
VSRSRIPIVAALFFVAAALTRFILYLVESRIQIGAFWLLAVIAGVLLPARCGRPASPIAIVASGITATAGVLLIKWLLEDDGYWGVRLSFAACHIGNCRIHR